MAQQKKNRSNSHNLRTTTKKCQQVDLIRFKFSENLKYKDLLGKIAKSLDKKPPKFPLTKGLLYTLYVLDKILYALGIKKSFMSQAFVQSLCSDLKYDGSKIEKKLAFSYQDTKITLEKISKDYNA